MIKKKEKVEFNVENLHLAEIRYLSLENNGVEFGNPIGYTFLMNRDSIYMELICCSSDIPVLKRLPFSNTTRDGEDYGSKMAVVGNKCYLESGPCYVLSNTTTREIFEKDVVSKEELEDYILASDKYFVDRKFIATERMDKEPSRMKRIIAKDKKDEEKYIKFFEERGVQLQKK